MFHVTCRLTAKKRDQLRSVIEYGLPLLFSIASRSKTEHVQNIWRQFCQFYTTTIKRFNNAWHSATKASAVRFRVGLLVFAEKRVTTKLYFYGPCPWLIFFLVLTTCVFIQQKNVQGVRVRLWRLWYYYYYYYLLRPEATHNTTSCVCWGRVDNFRLRLYLVSHA